MDTFIVVAQLVLAGVFTVAGVAKLFDLPGSRRAMTEFGVPGRAAAVAGAVLPFAELAAAAALVFHPSARWGALAALALLVMFTAGIANAMRRGRAPDCHCFGQVHSAPAGPWTLTRNIALAVLAAFVVVHGPGPAIDDWVAERSAAELVLIGLGLVALAVVAVLLRRRSRQRTLAATQAASTQTASNEREREGLPVGTTAPSFALADLGGATRTLDSLRARGRPVLLEFMDLSCAPCRHFLPFLARWQTTLADRVTIAIVTNGSIDQGPAWNEYGVTNVLFDSAREVIGAYRIQATPKAIGVWQDGTIAAAPAGGMHMPEVLVRILINGAAAHEAGAQATPVSPIGLRLEPGDSETEAHG
jgi:uncharacterized membrane protein YphA (DoxX/SURF4 family)/thiol-disulfide isomerase/thioredoxin